MMPSNNTPDDLPDFDPNAFFDSEDSQSSSESQPSEASAEELPDPLAETRMDGWTMPEPEVEPEPYNIAGEPGEELGRTEGEGLVGEPGEELDRDYGDTDGSPGDEIEPVKKGKGLLIGGVSVVAVAATAAGVYFSGLLGSAPAQPTKNSSLVAQTTNNTVASPNTASNLTTPVNPANASSTPMTDPATNQQAAVTETPSNTPTDGSQTPETPNKSSANAELTKTNPGVPVPESQSVVSFEGIQKLKPEERGPAITKLIESTSRLAASEAKNLATWVKDEIADPKNDEANKKKLATLQGRVLLRMADDLVAPPVVEEVPAETPTPETTPETPAPATEAANTKTEEAPAPSENESKSEAKDSESEKGDSPASEDVPQSETPQSAIYQFESRQIAVAPSPFGQILAASWMGFIDPQTPPKNLPSDSNDQATWDAQSNLGADQDQPAISRARANVLLARLCRKYGDWTLCKTFLNEIRENLIEISAQDVKLTPSEEDELAIIRENLARYELEWRIQDAENALKELRKFAATKVELAGKASKEELAQKADKTALDTKVNVEDFEKKLSSDQFSSILALENARDLLNNHNLIERLNNGEPEPTGEVTPEAKQRWGTRQQKRADYVRVLETIKPELEKADLPKDEVNKHLAVLRDAYQNLVSWELENSLLKDNPELGVDPKKLETQIASAIDAKLKEPLETIGKLPKDAIGKADVEKLLLPESKDGDKGSKADPRIALLTAKLAELKGQLDAKTKELDDKVAKAAEAAKSATTDAATASTEMKKLNNSLASVSGAATTLKNKVEELSSTTKKLTDEAQNSKTKLSETIASTRSALEEKIEAAKNAPRPLVPTERTQLANQATSDVLEQLNRMGYVPPKFSRSPVTRRPTPQEIEAGKTCFANGQIAFFSSDPMDLSKAIQQFALAVNYDPRRTSYRYYLGLALYRSGLFNQAAEQVRFAAEQEASSKSTMNYSVMERVQGPDRQWLEEIRRVVVQIEKQKAANPVAPAKASS